MRIQLAGFFSEDLLQPKRLQEDIFDLAPEIEPEALEGLGPESLQGVKDDLKEARAEACEAFPNDDDCAQDQPEEEVVPECENELEEVLGGCRPMCLVVSTDPAAGCDDEQEEPGDGPGETFKDKVWPTWGYPDHPVSDRNVSLNQIYELLGVGDAGRVVYPSRILPTPGLPSPSPSTRAPLRIGRLIPP